MERINKAAAVGVVLFSLILAGFVGMKVDQSTVGVLGGVFIGIAVAIPTTILLLYIGLFKVGGEAEELHTPAEQPPPPVFPQQQIQPAVHHHYHQHNTINVYVSRRGMSRFDECTEVATALNVSRYKAEQMIEAGEVKLLPPAK